MIGSTAESTIVKSRTHIDEHDKRHLARRLVNTAIDFGRSDQHSIIFFSLFSGSLALPTAIARTRLMECVLTAKKQYDRVVEQALRDAQNFLWANLPSTHNLPDDRTMACLRAIMGRPEVRQALELASDTVLCMALRAVNHILAEKAQPPGATFDRLWAVLATTELNGAFGTKQAGMTPWRKKPSTR
jgi:hypothetical protein